MAASVLVLRAPGGLHRHPAGHGHYLPRSDQQHAAAFAELSGCDCLHDVHWLSELYGVGTPHVCQWHESSFLSGVLLPYADYHHSSHHSDADLARQPVWLQAAYHRGITVCARIHLDVRQRRGERFFPGAALD